MVESAPPTWIELGVFDLHPESGELRKSGVRVKLHEKPLQLLLALLVHPGEIVTREELLERLWPDRSHLEFDNGLNNAVSRLRRALDDTRRPHRYIETIPHRGYRLMPGVVPPTVLASPRRQLWPWFAALGAAATLGAFILYAALRPPPVIRSLAVLPFRSRGTSAIDGHLASAVTDAVMGDLAGLGAPNVVREGSLNLQARANKSLAQIAHALGVNAVVAGAVTQEGGTRVRLTVRLFQADSERVTWSGTYERSMANVLALQTEVARGLARAIGLKAVSSAARPLASFHTVDARAYQASVSGSYFERQPNANFLPAGSDLRQVVRRKGISAPVYLGLSKFYLVLAHQSLAPRRALPLAKRYAEHALRLDPASAVAHSRLAEVDAADWDWGAADREFRRAIALAPTLASVRISYANYLGALGESKPALAQAQRAMELDPLSAAAHEALAAADFASGQYAHSMEQCRKILLLEPGQPMGSKCMSELMVYSGQYGRSLAEIKQYLAHVPGAPTALTLTAVAYAHLGRMRQARKFLARMKEEGRQHYVPPADLAAVLAAMGKDNAAIADLEKGYTSHDVDLVGLKTNVLFQPLAGDPRFQALVRGMHYPDRDTTEPSTAELGSATATSPSRVGTNKSAG